MFGMSRRMWETSLGWDAYEGHARLFNMAVAADKVAATEKATAAATTT